MNWFEWAENYLKLARESQLAEPANNFSPRAIQVLALSGREAKRLNGNCVGTEHVLLGLLRLGQGTSVAALVKAGMTLDAVRAEVELQSGPRPPENPPELIPYTPRAKKVVELARREAVALGNTFVGTEHLLLGLLDEADGPAEKIFEKFKLDKSATRQHLIAEMKKIAPPTDDSAKL